MNLDEHKSIRTHWIALYPNSDNITYFDSFGVEYISKVHTQQKYQNKYLWNARKWLNNIWIFLLGLLVFMLKGKSLIDYTNLFSPIQYEKKDEIILKSFQ